MRTGESFDSSFTVYINIIKDNACSKAGIVVKELWETFTSGGAKALAVVVKESYFPFNKPRGSPHINFLVF